MLCFVSMLGRAGTRIESPEAFAIRESSSMDALEFTTLTTQFLNPFRIRPIPGASLHI